MDSINASYSSTSDPQTFTVASSLAEFFQANWFEASCAILLLLVSFTRMACRGALRPPSAKLTKAFGQDSGGTDAEKQVRKLIYNLFDKANREAPNVFELYDWIVQQKAVNFREYIRDDGHAQALFISLITNAINSKRGDLISSLMADMQKMEIPRNLCFYASVMKVYASRNMYQEALKMYDYMVLDNLKPDGMMYICLMNDAIACSDLAKAQHFFTELCKVETPSLRTYMTILRTYQKENKWQAAVNVLSEMKSTGISPDNLVFNNVLGVCISAGQVDTAAKLLQDWKGTPDMVDVISYNTVLKGYAQQPNFEKSEAFLTKMQHDGGAGIAPNLISFNTVMDCAVRTMQVLGAQSGGRRRGGSRHDGDERDLSTCANFQAIARKPWEILDRMEAIGLVPDRYTCSTLIKGMHLSGCTVREIDRAMTLLKGVGPEALQSKDNDNARLHEVLFNSMLDACVNARDLNRMAEVFAMMRDCKVPVSAVTFGTLIKAFGQAGRLDRVREVWGEMRRANVRPTAVTYGCCIDACIRNGDIETAVKIFEEMKPDGCVPNTVIYTSLIRGFARSKQPERALAIYKEMRKQGVECSNVTFNSVLDVIARHVSDSDEMAGVLDDMRASQIRPDVVTYSILIKASCAAGNLGNAMSLFEQLKQENLVLDEIAFNSLLNGCSKNNKVSYAETVFQSMRELGVKPSNVTFSILVKMYGKAKMLDKAAEIMDLMETEYKEKPNLFVYTCLIQACVQNMQVKRGWDLFHAMQDKGIEPDAVTYGTLIHGCVYANKFDLAMILVKRAYNVESKEATGDRSPKRKMSPAGSAKLVQLQPEVLNALLSALNRKGKSDQAGELESLMSTNTVSIDPRALRRTNSNRQDAARFVSGGSGKDGARVIS
jgi:pentatricopeptide repeat protein